MAFGHRVRETRIAKGMTQQQLADVVKVNQPVIGSIEARDSETSKHASKIADALSVDLDWLLTGKSASGHAKVASNNASYGVDSKARNLVTPMSEDDIELDFYNKPPVTHEGGDQPGEVARGHKLRFSKASLKDANVAYEDAIALKATGDNMEGLIADGTTIAVDTSKAAMPIKDNRIYALEIDGDIQCKYIQRVAGGKVKLISENTMYDDEIYEMDEFLKLYRIIGWVFWWSTLAKW